MREHRRAVAPGEGWTSEVSSAVALAGFLFLVFVGFTLLAMGPLISLDAYFNLTPPPPAWVSFLHVLDRIGQRAICLPVLAVAMLVCSRRVRSWRPVWLVGASVFSVNLVVLILKVGLGRGQPEKANPSFFVGGMAYPSGHTANIVLVYGLVVYLLGHFLRLGRRTQGLLWATVVVLSLTMVATSLTLNWHWFADLIAGLLIGGVVLELTAAVDAAFPHTVLDRGPLEVWRAVAPRLRDRRADAAVPAAAVAPAVPASEPAPPARE